MATRGDGFLVVKRKVLKIRAPMTRAGTRTFRWLRRAVYGRMI